MTFKDITHGGFYIYINFIIIMHWAVKWHKEHEDLTIGVPGLSGLLMDRQCIQILIVNTQSPFNYIYSNFKMFTNPNTC